MTSDRECIEIGLKISLNLHYLNGFGGKKYRIRIKDGVNGPSINEKVEFLTCRIQSYPELLGRDGNECSLGPVCFLGTLSPQE